MEVGEYIRTPFGIRKIKNITKDDGYGKPRVKVIELDMVLDTFYKYSYTFYTDEKIIKEAKHSFNIIDLIQVGDYVNWYLVKDIDYAFDDVIMNKKNARYVPYIDCNKNNYIDDIKSIVTKEQFESIEYRVGE